VQDVNQTAFIVS